MNNNQAVMYSTKKGEPWGKTVLQAASNQQGQENTLEITSERYQTIDGFGGCFNELGWNALGKISDEKKKEILDELFLNEDGCHFNICRLPIGASDYAMEWYSLNETENDFEMKEFSIDRDQKYLIPYIREALKRQPDIKLFASPWSPPTWMKFPKAYNFGTMIWEKEILDAYALYFLKFIEAYKKEGIDIHQIHIQNEPMSTQKFPSCVWTGEQLREFIADYIGPLFEKHNIDTEIWLGTLNGPANDGQKLTTDYDDYANWVLSDMAARKYIKGVSYQWAGKNAIQRTYQSWPDIKLMQSENECGNGQNTWEYAHYVFRLFHQYLTNGTNSYIYWNMALEPEGRSTWGWSQNAMITINPAAKEVIYNPEFYVMKHFSHFIKPGAVRLGTKGNMAGNAVAFENPDGSVAVIANNGMKKERNIELKINNTSYNITLSPESFYTFLV